MLVFYCILTAALFICLENIFPDQKLKKVTGWYKRSLIINGFYASLIVFTGIYIDPYFQKIHATDMLEDVSAPLAGLMAYFALSFVYYWWHRFRHESDFLWRWFHQLHHSPQRIETITSLYKHPFEIIFNTLLTNTVAFIFLGLNIEQSLWMIYFLAVAEYIYHMNIKTPHLLGYIFQRPEMHRVHHQKGLHRYNYSDLPIWDLIFGTFHNPKEQNAPCGFDDAKEIDIKSLLLGRKV